MRSAATARPQAQPRQQPVRAVAASQEMVSLLRDAALSACSDARVLITGESGVGKDLVAEHIHAHSARVNAPYVPLKCAGLTDSQLESALVAKLLLADRGSLFLDDVSEMSLQLQAALLHFLQTGEIHAGEPVSSPYGVDVRVIAACSRDLPELVRQGRFRDDLLYRLRVIHLHVPPLRERREDIRPLATHFLARAGRPVMLSDEAWQALDRYGWPGNVRELKNLIDELVSRGSGDRPITVQALPSTIQCAQPMAGKERRRQVADDLYQALVGGGYSFWQHIHVLFLNRDITRHDLRELVRRGLKASNGNYRSLLQLFGIPKTDYKRFMNFLATHECRIDYREFRNGHAEPERLPRLVLPPLEPRDEKKATRTKAPQKHRTH